LAKYKPVISNNINKTMKFQITVSHRGQQLTMSVNTAVYFDMIVYQVSADNIKTIVYLRDGKWQSTNDKPIEQEFLDKVGAAIAEQVCGVRRAG
jgi:hypothetical protein